VFVVLDVIKYRPMVDLTYSINPQYGSVEKIKSICINLGTDGFYYISTFAFIIFKGIYLASQINDFYGINLSHLFEILTL
jgi:hypothetical protein